MRTILTITAALFGLLLPTEGYAFSTCEEDLFANLERLGTPGLHALLQDPAFPNNTANIGVASEQLSPADLSARVAAFEADGANMGVTYTVVGPQTSRTYHFQLRYWPTVLDGGQAWKGLGWQYAMAWTDQLGCATAYPESVTLYNLNYAVDTVNGNRALKPPPIPSKEALSATDAAPPG